MDDLSRVKLVVFDVDLTLVVPRDKQFYDRYGDAVRSAITKYFKVDEARAQEIADFYRKHYGGAEQALFSGAAKQHFAELPDLSVDTTTLYDQLILINPDGKFIDRSKLAHDIQKLRTKGIKVVALTSSPDVLAESILKQSGFGGKDDFDDYIAYQRLTGPPKMFSDQRIFERIMMSHVVTPECVISIGDSLLHDILPAQALGALTCLITPLARVDGYTGMVAADAQDVVNLLLENN